jgi:hypothetical protein
VVGLFAFAPEVLIKFQKCQVDSRTERVPIANGELEGINMENESGSRLGFPGRGWRPGELNRP